VYKKYAAPEVWSDMATPGNDAVLKRKRTVLAAGRDSEVLHILEVNLTHVSLGVIMADSGKEVLARARDDAPDLILLDDSLLDMDAQEVCASLNSRPSTSHIPVMLISDGRSTRLPPCIDQVLLRPFEPNQVISAVMASLKRSERAQNVNPQTGLPGRSQVTAELAEMIESGVSFTAIFIDLESLRDFNRGFGFAEGDRAIRNLAENLCEAVRLFGSADDLVGHLGGDNFVVVTTTGAARLICRKIISDHDARMKAFGETKAHRGAAGGDEPAGMTQASPSLSVKAAVVSSESCELRHYLELEEIAREQMRLLKGMRGSSSYYDLWSAGIQAVPGEAAGRVSDSLKEEVVALRQQLAWVAFLVREMGMPIAAITGSVDRLEGANTASGPEEHLEASRTLRQSIAQLGRVIEEIGELTWTNRSAQGTALDDGDVKNVLARAVSRARDIAEERRLDIAVESAGSLGWIHVDAVDLTQAIFYTLRSLAKFSSPGSKIVLRSEESTREWISIDVANQELLMRPQMLAALSQGQLDDVWAAARQTDFWLASALLRPAGGKLTAESKGTIGTVFRLAIPRRWSSSRAEINSLLSAVEASWAEAREQLGAATRALASPAGGRIPRDVEKTLDGVSAKVHELTVLCNRSLLLADGFSRSSETQQDELEHLSLEQVAAAESMLVACREIAASTSAVALFDRECAFLAAKCALAIAAEFGMLRGMRQTLHVACLLKDLRLAMSSEELVKNGLALTSEQAIAIRIRFSAVWKALNKASSFAPALALMSGINRSPGSSGFTVIASGANSALSARIFDVADAFVSSISGVSAWGSLTPDQAAARIMDGSGVHFDAQVAAAFQRAWNRKAIQVPVL
jgi:diguanylate cyclase (GGDEF)-like protein